MLSGVSASFLILAIVILQGLTANTCNNNNNNMQSVETRMNLCKVSSTPLTGGGCNFLSSKVVALLLALQQIINTRAFF